MSETINLECMTDLETLGNRNNAVILSIGACFFIPDGQGIRSDSFEVFVDPQSCVDIGMEMDPSTVLWWMGSAVKNNEERAKMNEARDIMVEKQKKAVHIRDALHRFSAWFGSDKPNWGNGATFDNVILRNAYELAGIPCPWSFWNDRCYRTMKNLAPSVKMQRQGVHHSAMWDAISQALHLQEITRSITTSGE